MNMNLEHKYPRSQISKKDFHRDGVIAASQLLGNLPTHKVVLADRSRDKVDLIFTNQVSKKRYRVKVCISDRGNQENIDFGSCLFWLFSTAVIPKPADDLFYCFIDYQEQDDDNANFNFYIVPSAKVIKSLDDLYRLWLKAKKGRSKTNPLRHFVLQVDNNHPFVSEDYSLYSAKDFVDNWDLME